MTGKRERRSDAKHQHRRQSGRMKRMNFLTVQYGGLVQILPLGTTDTNTTKSQEDGQNMAQSVIDSGRRFVFTNQSAIDSAKN